MSSAEGEEIAVVEKKTYSWKKVFKIVLIIIIIGIIVVGLIKLYQYILRLMSGKGIKSVNFEGPLEKVLNPIMNPGSGIGALVGLKALKFDTMLKQPNLLGDFSTKRKSGNILSPSPIRAVQHSNGDIKKTMRKLGL